MTKTEGSLPPQFWSAPVVAAALAACDIPAVLIEIRRANGWTQDQLAEAVGYSQSWVSKVLRHRQPLTVDQVREISSRIGIPIHLLRFGARGDDDPTKRRDFGKAVALTALTAVPLPKRAEVDETTAPTLTGITGAQRRLESTTPARELARGAMAHVDLANRILNRTGHSAFTGDLRAVMSEAAGFAAWVHADMHDTGTSRTYYRLAIDSARHAEHSLLAAYMIGSLAAFEIATAKSMAGHHDEAFHLAANALTLGVTYGSERIIQRARRFRRAYNGPANAAVRAFDERLRATLL
ncbi:helix-turn-helix transcriptional regulator [Streptosporangium subroseum]|uniref:helix-turn-helix domain-containing protein n=1 Tax=Streptosporangium subroseum TaxID=106412 RepID=UPI0034484D82